MSDRHLEIRRAVEARADAQLAFLIELCDQNSHSLNKAGVDRVAAMLLEKLGDILPAHRVWPQTDLGDHHLLRTSDDGPAVYLVGHMDTVFPADHPFQRCRREGHRLIGPGVGDMKGGLVVFVFALLALAELRMLPGMNVALFLNSDEEIGSVTSGRLFTEAHSRARACLGGECAGYAGQIVTSRNGKLGGRVDSYGKARHVGSGTHEKASAVLELAQVVVALEGLNAVLPGVSVNCGRIEGGLSPASIADHAQAWVDVRWQEEDHAQELRERIAVLLAEPRQAGCRSEFTELNRRPAWPPAEPSRGLFALAARAGARLGLRLEEEHRRGTSDVNFFGAAGVPALDGFGPLGEGDHTADEFIWIPSLQERTALLALLLGDLAAPTGG